MDLSPLDLKILRFVKFNGMIPSRELAQRLRVSPTTIDYKLKKLEEENVITGYKYRVDYGKLGLNKLAWVFLGVQRHGASLNKVISTLLEDSHAHNVMLLTGEYDMALKIYGRDINNIADFVFRIKSELKGTIRSVNTVFAMKTYKLNQVPIEDCRKRVNLSRSELKILKYLLGNPRARIKDVARDMKLHRNTASSKLKMFNNRGIIIKRSPLINQKYYHPLGIAFKSIVFIDAMTGHAETLAKKLVENNAIHELFATSTDHDIMAIVRNKDLKELSDFQVMLYSDPAYKGLIYDTKTMCILDVLADRSDESACLEGLYS